MQQYFTWQATKPRWTKRHRCRRIMFHSTRKTPVLRWPAATPDIRATFSKWPTMAPGATHSNTIQFYHRYLLLRKWAVTPAIRILFVLRLPETKKSLMLWFLKWRLRQRRKVWRNCYLWQEHHSRCSCRIKHGESCCSSFGLQFSYIANTLMQKQWLYIITL